MQLRKLLEQWDLDSLKIKAGFLEMEWVPRDEDKNAAWELYVELLTRVATQRLVPAQGTERAALGSIYQLFPLTREIIKRNGRPCANFAKLAVVVLNQIVRPFTTRWHAPLEEAQPLSPRCRESQSWSCRRARPGRLSTWPRSSRSMPTGQADYRSWRRRSRVPRPHGNAAARPT